MRIALVDWRCSRPGQDGIVTDIVWSLASRLAAGGDDVHVVGSYAQADAPAPGVQVHSFRILPPGYRSIVGLLLQSASAWATLRAIRGVQIVHAADYFNSGLIIGLGAPWPVVLTTPCNADERLANVHSFGLMWAP